MTRTRDEIVAEIDRLQRMRAKRYGKPGFSANVIDIDAAIAAANAELAALDG